MSSVMPGQNMEDSALAIMAEVPWWAACSAARQSDLRDSGITMQSLYKITPSMVWRCSRKGWNALSTSGMSRRSLESRLSKGGGGRENRAWYPTFAHASD